MTPSDLAEFRAWAEQHAPLGYVPAVRAAELLAERDAILAALADRCYRMLSHAAAELDRLRAENADLRVRLLAAVERIAGQAELLARKAEVSA